MRTITQPSPGEEVLFRGDVVVVTDKRVVFQTKSFTASAISSISVAPEPQKRRRRRLRWSAEDSVALAVVVIGMIMGAGGALLARGTIAIQIALGAWGLLVIGFGSILYTRTRAARTRAYVERYTVTIATIDGEKGKVNGLDEETARRLATAISTASTRK